MTAAVIDGSGKDIYFETPAALVHGRRSTCSPTSTTPASAAASPMPRPPARSKPKPASLPAAARARRRNGAELDPAGSRQSTDPEDLLEGEGPEERQVRGQEAGEEEARPQEVAQASQLQRGGGK